MNHSIPLACRHCQFYELEGRRGGSCQRLGAHVQGDWQGCALMIPCFGSIDPIASTVLEQLNFQAAQPRIHEEELPQETVLA